MNIQTGHGVETFGLPLGYEHAPNSGIHQPKIRNNNAMNEFDDKEVICFCNYVTAGEIRRAIESKGLKTTAEVMGETYAAGLCGSCLDNVNKITKHIVDELN
jgi:NAD(P)H-nitrite reductase large subunit